MEKKRTILIMKDTSEKEINIKDEIERFKNNHKNPIVWIKTDFGFERKIKTESNE